jgi:hypothetical protein
MLGTNTQVEAYKVVIELNNSSPLFHTFRSEGLATLFRGIIWEFPHYLSIHTLFKDILANYFFPLLIYLHPNCCYS